MGGGGKPPAVQPVLEPLLLEMQMLINNELAFALVLASQFLYCRAPAHVGVMPYLQRCRRVSCCPGVLSAVQRQQRGLSRPVQI